MVSRPGRPNLAQPACLPREAAVLNISGWWPGGVHVCVCVCVCKRGQFFVSGRWVSLGLNGAPTPPPPASCSWSPDCQEEQYPCTRLYSIYKPCKQCLNEICFYSLRRVYVINKEICVRTVCAHEELLRGTHRERRALRS
uniref:Microfibril associated protein 2 n=1 Tax=Naja naja TaxID=35670 RepID=A0A8C6XQD5_NAJNA